LDSDYPDFMSIHGGIIVLDFPLDFLTGGEKSKTITVTVKVIDQDDLQSVCNMTIIVMRNVVVTEQQPLLWLGLLGSAGAMAVLSAYAIARRRKPFVIHDMMLIHNDGFLMGRHAAPEKGEIDENILSGMLTAVLNFVEDSMSSSEDTLKTFGFEHYQVLVKRAKLTYAAVVYDGDPPANVEEALAEFLGKFEKVYWKRISNWTGDIDTDFAGVELLIQAFVKAHSKKTKGRVGGIWKVWQEKKPEPTEQPVLKKTKRVL